MILPALSAGLTSDSPATTCVREVWAVMVQSIGASVQTADSDSLQEPFGRGGR
jgi:hypothetical protein